METPEVFAKGLTFRNCDRAGGRYFILFDFEVSKQGSIARNNMEKEDCRRT
jgi:hypothetical protein